MWRTRSQPICFGCPILRAVSSREGWETTNLNQRFSRHRIEDVRAADYSAYSDSISTAPTSQISPRYNRSMVDSTKQERKAPFTSHALFSNEPDFTPSSNQILEFFDYLSAVGVVSAPISIRLRIPSGEDMYARNPRTGEKISLGKRLKDVPVSGMTEIKDLIQASPQYALSIESSVPVRLIPFNILEKDGAKLDPSGACELQVKCLLNERRTQLSEPWHEHLRIFLLSKETENACERCGAIHTPEGEVQPRFWIEFSITDAFLPSFKDSNFMRSEVLAGIEAVFDTQLFHGRFFD